jgi:hypothetical protein
MIGRKTLKQILVSLLGGILFLTARGQTSYVTPTTTIPIISSATATPSPNPTNISTSVPTETPTAPITPLGSDYHGSQSHIYVRADVCPFR